MRKLFDRSLFFFLLIGVLNTLLSAGIMYLLYTRMNGGYWLSSAIAFALTSVLSFFLNKRFSFRSDDPVGGAALRFALVILVCYVIAYLIAKPATALLLAAIFPAKNLPVEKIALFTGQILFTGLNYIGQRFFAFRKKDMG